MSEWTEEHERQLRAWAENDAAIFDSGHNVPAWRRDVREILAELDRTRGELAEARAALQRVQEVARADRRDRLDELARLVAAVLERRGPLGTVIVIPHGAPETFEVRASYRREANAVRTAAADPRGCSLCGLRVEAWADSYPCRDGTLLGMCASCARLRGEGYEDAIELIGLRTGALPQPDGDGSRMAALARALRERAEASAWLAGELATDVDGGRGAPASGPGEGGGGR